MLKIIIVLFFIGLVASLFTGFGFLLKDNGNRSKNGTWIALSVRLVLTLLLIITVYYGVSTGQLHSSAPWSQTTSAQ